LKGDFLNIAAHELRCPLGIINGYVSMLLDGTLTELTLALKPILAVDASDDLFHDDVHYIDGLPHLDEYALMIDHLTMLPPAPDFPLDDGALARMDTEPWLISFLAQAQDGPFWRRASLRPDYGRLTVPAYLIGGWYDGYRDSVPRMLAHVPAPVKVLIGPWNHTYPHNAVPGPAIEAYALPGLPGVERAAAALGSAVVIFAVLLLGARLLLARPAPVRALWPAAVLGAAAVTLALNLGAPLLARLVSKAGPVYGSFATVAGMFALLYLVNQALVYAAEVAAVRHARLWPRALDVNRPTAADARAMALLAREQERIPAARVAFRLVSRDSSSAGNGSPGPGSQESIRP